ncbi:ABC transporter ATP-binding protein/permease [Gammaproteobacteria bacterium]|nr:ABC transporter ATP-binding protein/permease [Gammaproteobacteria bacterium]
MKVVFELLTKSKDFIAQFIVLVLLVITLALLNSISIFTIAPVVDILLEKSPSDYSTITILILKLFNLDSLTLGYSFLFFGLSLILSGVAAVVVQYMVFKIKYSVVIHIMSGAFDQFFKSKYSFFSESDMGMLLNSFQRESDKIGSTIGNIAKFIANSLQVILFLSVPFFISSMLTTIFICCALVICIPIWIVNKKVYPLGALNTSTANNISGILHQSFSASKLIIAYGNQKITRKNYKNSFFEHAKVSIPFQTILYGINILFMPLGMSAALFSIYWGYLLGVSLSEMAMILFAFFRMMPIAGNLFQIRAEIIGFTPAFEQLQKLISNSKKYEEIQTGEPFKGFKSSIAFEDLTFSYNNSGPVLKEINIEFSKNKTTAIVGRSGSGKTTIGDILLGLYKPDSGFVMIDENDFSSFNINSFREQVGYVSQEPFLFDSSIKENMLWSKPDASDEDIWNALRLSNLEEFVKGLPNELDASMGDRGGKISGGQRQRMALARAMLRKPQILLLDEATSALDNESEKLIQLAINNLASKTTIVIIAHRLTTIKNVDHVYVLDHGSILEHGSYQELADNKKSKFSEMLSQS